MKSILILAILAVTSTSAMCADLPPIKDVRLASVLGLSEEISPKLPTIGMPLFVRVYAAPSFIGECDGSVASCPDVRLFVSVSSGDLGETPALYELPAAKGWDFKGWDKSEASSDKTRVGFVVQTALPESNIEASDRKAWHSESCHVLVSSEAASYSCR